MGKSLVSRVVGAIISIALIIGGASGQLVLRGTNSSTALVIFGVGFLIVDIFLIIKDIIGKNKSKVVVEAADETASQTEPLELPCTIKIIRDDTGASFPITVILNDVEVGALKSGEELSCETVVSVNKLFLKKHDGELLKDFWEVTRPPLVFKAESGANSEIHFKQQTGFIDETMQGLTMISK